MIQDQGRAFDAWAPGTRKYHEVPVDRRPDAALAERLMERDESALREAIERYGPLVMGMARRIVAEPSLAEEVAQDAFLALWRRPGAYDPDRGTLQSFLAGVARNKAIDLVRKEESRKRARESLVAEVEANPWSGANPGPADEIHERQRMKKALEQLSDIQREALVLAYFGGRTYREVAEELDIPEGTAKTRLRDGLARLREVLVQQESGRG